MTNKVDPYSLEAGVPKIEGNLRPAPKMTDRISKRVLGVAFGLVALMAGIFLFALDSMDSTKAPPPPEMKTVAAESTQDDSLGLSVLGVSGQANKVAPPIAPKESVVPPEKGVLVDKSVAGKVPAMGSVPPLQDIPPVAAYTPVKALTPAEQLENQEKLARLTRMNQARSNGLSGKVFGSGEKAAGLDMAGLLAAAKASAGLGPGAGAGQSSPRVDGEQDSKLDFLKSVSKEESPYHPHTAMSSLSLNEVKVGSFIPMVLQQSINSDLPGQITARVTEDVYDTISGCRLLIPSLSTVIGRYDSKVALGQGRLLVSWSSMVFPDGAELALGGMQGYDTSGQSGLESDVDNHYWRMFGITFGLSMITSAVTLSVPKPAAGANGAAPTTTPEQTIAAALAQQYGALGAQILGKYMAVQPTLRNFAGERFVVMVPRTILLKKVWRNRCAVQG